MKKILVITSIFWIGLTSNLFAQCTMDPAVVAANIPGIFPTPVDTLPSGKVGGAYSKDFTIIIPADTTISIPPAPATTLTVNSVTITGITGLPAGLTHTCDVTSCLWPGNSKGCFVIDGTPTQAGTFTVSVEVVVNVDAPIIGATDAPTQNIDYTLVIDPSGVGISPVDGSAFEVYPISPNPSTNGAEIKFNAPDYRAVNLTVHNMIGALVMSKQIAADQGMNTVTFGADDLKAGVYIVTLSDGDSSATKRMVVGSN